MNRNEEIYYRHKGGATLTELAKEFNISNARAGQIYKTYEWHLKWAERDRIEEAKAITERKHIISEIKEKGSTVKLTPAAIDILFEDAGTPYSTSRAYREISFITWKSGGMTANEILKRLADTKGVGIKTYNAAYDVFHNWGLLYYQEADHESD